MYKICYLVCAGEECRLDFKKKTDDLVIAVDGGLKYLERAGIIPDVIIGDFDSLGYVPDGEIIKLDPEKDVTDSFAAAKEGLRRGYKVFKIYCALGGRLSHTLSNIALLNYIFKSGGEGEIVNGYSRARIISGHTAVAEGGYMSLLPLAGRASVTITGCKYSGDFTLTGSDSLGISNEPQKNAAVTVHSGVVLMITERG